MRTALLIASIGLGLAACAPEPPASPAERHARMAAAAELAAQRCGAFVGGYSQARDLRSDANKNITTARTLGATDEMLAKARKDTQGVFDTAEIFTDRQTACNELISSLAWAQG